MSPMRWTPGRQVALCLLTLLAIVLLTAVGRALLESAQSPGSPRPPTPPAPTLAPRAECTVAGGPVLATKASPPAPPTRRPPLTARGARALDPATWDLRRPVAVPLVVLRAWFHGTPLAQDGIPEAILAAQEEYGVNALVLAAIIIHESGWGRSRLAREKCNLSGYGAGDLDPYRRGRSFANPAACVDATAQLLAGDYLTPAGRYYHGVTLAAVGVCYASNPRWAAGVDELVREGLAVWAALEAGGVVAAAGGGGEAA